ncbi:hypothetical protein [Desmospora activa]|uniref:Uncharacterized protein n=1 Tax=Desmospora activa DSM 45169 TaxID=1121389 RepID=A0A2T4Z906_9BACL|nr:hypothetical protein [Desmospora activa]PTM58381.1 hypothetical protein C8J48_0963 [Desmospora activa DSM 45169]
MAQIPRSGITKDTAKNVLVDAGILIVNFGESDQRQIGATSGGNTVAQEVTIRESEPDGARGPVEGLRDVETAYYRLTVNLFEHTLDNLKTILRAEEETSENGYKKIRPRLDILEQDYLKNIALAVRIKNSDKYVVHVLENALPDSEIEMGSEDKADLVTEVQFTAHYDPADVLKAPYYILYPEGEDGGGVESLDV